MPRKYTVDSFPTEFITLWKKATKEPVEFMLPYNQAVRARQELYKLRTAMKEEKHVLRPHIAGLSITLDPPDARGETEVTLRVGQRVENIFLGMVQEELAEEIAQQDRELEELGKTQVLLTEAVEQEEREAAAEPEQEPDVNYENIFRESN